MYFLIAFFLFFWMPPIFNGLTQLNQDLINWADSAQFYPENLRIYSNDLAVCLDSMRFYNQFDDFGAIKEMSKTNPLKTILSILQCMPDCEALTLNHYNVLFQCLAQQRDNTKCCVSQIESFIKSLSAGESKEYEEMHKTWIPPKGLFWKLPLGALTKENVLPQFLPTEEERLAKEINWDVFVKLKEEKIAEIGQEIRFKPNQCIKLCNAEFPINPWYYLPLIRSGACEMVISVGGFVAASSILIGRFNSLMINAETDMMEIIDYPVVKLFTKFTNCKEPVIKNLAEAVFDLPMKHFRQIGPSKEEFVLILALLFTNSTTPSLSKYGQGIMNAETEKYTKILLRLQQRQFGEQKGALRFSECLQLLWNAISSVQKHRELIVYMDSVYEQGRFDKIMPKILAHLVA